MATESVWDYPRPPAIVGFDGLVEIIAAGVTLISTHDSVRVLETSHPPVFYVPLAEIAPGVMQRSAARRSFCEFKGFASYWDAVVGNAVLGAVAWGYDDPTAGYEELVGRVAFYPGRMDACVVDGEQVQAQEGDFYGGWITSSVVGPFKGAAGTLGW